jgi:dipeptidyl aminopeptidase/acylaminoacyl peptidase
MKTRSFGAICGTTCLLALSGGLLVHARAQVKVPSVPSNPDAIRDIGNMLREWSIAFNSNADGTGSSILRSMRPDGTAAVDFWGTRITVAPAGYALTPDGKTLIYCDTRVATYSQQAGRPATRIMHLPIREINVSPDGRKMLYVREGRPLDNDIFVSNIDGTGERALTSRSGIGERYPNWSPDGRKILYTSFEAGQNVLMVMEADGTGQHAITRPAPRNPDGTCGVNYKRGKWSPDGSKIAAIGYSIIAAVSSPTLYMEQIYALNSDGTSPRQLTAFARQYNTLSWSPDGKKILFSARLRRPLKDDIFIMNADGSGETNLTNTSDISEIFPEWQAPIAPRRLGL